MQFEKLRIVGFKSFVDPTEFAIEPGGLTVLAPPATSRA